MGRQAKHTTLTIDGRDHAGDVLLETDELLLSLEGEPKRRRLKLAALEHVGASADRLLFRHAGHRFEIAVPGPARWAARITSPPTLLEKLGITTSRRVHVEGLEDETAFTELLVAAKIEQVPLGERADVVVRGIRTRAALSIVKRARRAVGDHLALWIVYPRGHAELTEDHVRSAAVAEGMVDVLVARFSDVRSALKLVVRKSERKTAKAPRAKRKV